MSTQLLAHLSRLTRHSSLPDDDALQRNIADTNRATDKIARERAQMNFGATIAQAVKRKQLASAQSSRTAGSAEGGDFGEKIKREVQKRSPQKRHKEHSEHDRSRYTKLRKRTKSG